jgi:hypothetical protein
MTAVRIEGEIVVDGELDEAEWRHAEPATDFIQRLPYTGRPATERTEARLLYDDRNLYVGVYCFDSAGPEGIVVKDIKRDFMTLESDGFQIVIDTFNDDRNSFLFAVNPAGGRWDMQIGADGAAGNRHWEGIWYSKTRITEAGWQAELAIPFKTLRFSKAADQIWGVNYERRVRRKSEDSYWSPLPAAYRLGRVSLAGTLDGISGVRQGRNLVVKPYVLTPFLRREGDDFDFQPDAGLDVKYSVSSQMTLDLTVNPDFAQVEADVQQINLTRFNLFFPEKREFFLENAGIFQFGRAVSTDARPDVMPFFSRRIGLSDDRRVVPIFGGARLSGRAGRFTMGMLSMQSDEFEETPSTNFSVLRLRRDVLRKSDIGAIFVNKQVSGGDYNRTYGADANFTLLNYLEFSSYILKTETPGLVGKDTAYDFELNWKDDFWDVGASHLSIGENFRPEVGYLARQAIRKSSGHFAITSRPGERMRLVRYWGPAVDLTYITDQQNVPESKAVDASMVVVFNSGATAEVGTESSFERLAEPFFIRGNQTIAAGDYRFRNWYALMSTDQHRLFSANAGVASGSFYDGDRNTYTVGMNFAPGYHFSTGVTWSHNDIELPSGDFSTNLVAARVGYLFSNRMFLNGLIQYNSDTRETSSNIRFNLIHRPLSDLYIVYNERRSSVGDVRERALIAKLTYAFDF